MAPLRRSPLAPLSRSSLASLGRSLTIVKQVREKESSIHDYASYIPIGNAVQKLSAWQNQGAEIYYLTSRTDAKEVGDIKHVLKENNFPTGQLFFRKQEEYKDVPERVIPDILIEDDCESIGGINKMAITHMKPEIRKRIKSIVVKEYNGIDHLPDNIHELVSRELKGGNMDINLFPNPNISWEQDRCPWNESEGTTKHKCAVKDVSICKHFQGIKNPDIVLCSYPI